MRITHSVLSSYRRLVSAVYGVSKTDVRIQPQLKEPSLGEPESEGAVQSLEVNVGEDACFVANNGVAQVLGELPS